MIALLDRLTEGWTSVHYIIVAVLLLFWLGSCIRLAVAASRGSTETLSWMLPLTILTLGLATWIIIYVRSVREARQLREKRKHARPPDLAGPGSVPGMPIICPHCGSQIAPQEFFETPGPLNICPRCETPLSEDRLA